jgi:hypothetical protein
MRNGIAPERPAALAAGMFFLSPSTAAEGASLVQAADWSIFDADGVEQDREWSEEEIVFLHWRLLQDVQLLADPAAPLQEKISTLGWIFTEPEKDPKPFSFASCLRVVACSPLSPIAYCGPVDCEAIREHIAGRAGRWLRETLARYPLWVTDALAHDPEWVDAQLERNPQWINEQISQLAVQGDLFA